MQTNNYRVIRSARRKRISFRFAADGVLEVLIPEKMSSSLIPLLIAQNQETLQRLKQRTPQRNIPDFHEGSMFMLLGTPYPLRFTGRLLLFDDAFLIPAGQDAKNSMIRLYKKLAASIFREKVPAWAVRCGVCPQKIRISSAATRWGSCTSQGILSFSWKLIQCPAEFVDYVIVHELSHLKEMNHSPRFWRLVENVIPDCKQKRELLNQFARKLPIWD